MQALIAYGSKHGGTAGLADMVGESLERRGITADVRPAIPAPDVAGFDLVVVGGALYADHWHRSARRFVRRRREELLDVPVWFFSSGPLDASAGDGSIAPVPQVAQLMEHVNARGHRTFGGRLEPDVRGFPAREMARTKSGDWRDAEAVDGWVGEIVGVTVPDGCVG